MSIVKKNRSQIIVRGIVRHYHISEDKESTPYRGVLKTEQDRNRSDNMQLSNLLEKAKDGASVEIIINFGDEHPKAKDHIWMLTKPHTYKRIKKVN